MNASALVPDDLWEAIESLVPDEPPKPNGGRPRVADRAALVGIVFVLRTGQRLQGMQAVTNEGLVPTTTGEMGAIA